MTSRLDRAYNRLTGPLAQLTLAFIVSRVITDLSLIAFRRFPHLLPLFDSSPALLAGNQSSSHILRWDAFHYLSVAQNGYEWEQQVAFMPGLPALIRGCAESVLRIQRIVVGGTAQLGLQELEAAGIILSSVARISAIKELFFLSEELYGRSFAMITALLYVLAPCPAAMSSTYTEAPFAWLAFAGYRCALDRQWLSASLLLAAATSIRATGVFNAIVIVIMVLQDSGGSFLQARAIRRLPQAGIYALIIVLPFVAFQLYTYASFCSGISQAAWCATRLPFSYSHVQSTYWNNGLFKYWEVAQLGNWILPIPILAISLYATYIHLQQPTKELEQPLPSADKRLLGIQLHHLITTLLLVFVSNVQIALRVAVTNPVVWWTAAELAFDWSKPKGTASLGEGSRDRMTRIGRWWIGWCVIWGAISIVLWAGFYPPA